LALSIPVDIHDKKIKKNIDLNIIGTVNIVNDCSNFKIKFIYSSTGYVYPNKIGCKNDNNPVLDINNYTWS
tara:strand:- start:418 stop:630 length:213 start_codon:yes stop_codon:yes gene_type:complete